MTARSVVAFLLAVVVAASAIELSTWVLGRAVAAIMPSSSVSEVNAEVPYAADGLRLRQPRVNF